MQAVRPPETAPGHEIGPMGALAGARSLPPQHGMPIRVVTRPPEPARGEPVEVIVDRTQLEPGLLVELRLRCLETTQRKNTAHTQMTYEQDFVEVPDLDYPVVETELPADAPYSYEGVQLRWGWEVDVRVRKPGWDPVFSHPFWVHPGRVAALPGIRQPQEPTGPVSIEIEDPQAPRAPGDTIRGTGHFLAAVPGDARASFIRCDRGAGLLGTTEVAPKPLATSDVATRAGASVGFEITVPGDAMPDHQTDRGDVWWEVGFLVEDPRRGGIGASVPIVVSAG